MDDMLLSGLGIDPTRKEKFAGDDDRTWVLMISFLTLSWHFCGGEKLLLPAFSS
jgi:hypothetical protein